MRSSTDGRAGGAPSASSSGFTLACITALASLCLVLLPYPGVADESMAERVRAQMAVADRHKFDLPRDPHRKAVETFEFLGIRTGMTVMDVAAYAGYTTELLAAAVGPEGIVYSQNRPRVLSHYAQGYYQRTMDERLAGDRLPNVRMHVREYEEIGLAGQIDVAFLGNILHDFQHRDGEATTLRYLRSIRGALKPGGILGVTDHVGLADADNAALHRMTEADARRLLEAAGFEIDRTSDIFANPADPHDVHVYDETIYRRTDRFFLRARNPQGNPGG